MHNKLLSNPHYEAEENFINCKTASAFRWRGKHRSFNNRQFGDRDTEPVLGMESLITLDVK